MIRTVTFKSVLDGVMRRLGRDPEADDSAEACRAVTELVNERIRAAWETWPWQELMETEERAYRPLWHPSVATSAGDEVFYLPTGSYFRAKAAAAAGIDPTDSTIFEPIYIPAYAAVPFIQPGQQTIGQVFDAYLGDPQSGARSVRRSSWRQSENGITFAGGARGATVWLTFRIAPSQFTTVPHTPGRNYRAGELAYNPENGECYVALVDNPDSSAESPRWFRQAFPEIFASYVKTGAFADALLDLADEGALTEGRHQLRLARAKIARAQADEMLGALVGRQQEQGDRATYSLRTRSLACAVDSWGPALVLLETAAA